MSRTAGQCSCSIMVSHSQLHQKKWLGSFGSADDSSFPQPVKPFVLPRSSPFPLSPSILVPISVCLPPLVQFCFFPSPICGFPLPCLIFSLPLPVLSLLLHPSSISVCPHPSLPGVFYHSPPSEPFFTLRFCLSTSLTPWHYHGIPLCRSCGCR